MQTRTTRTRLTAHARQSGAIARRLRAPEQAGAAHAVDTAHRRAPSPASGFSLARALPLPPAPRSCSAASAGRWLAAATERATARCPTEPRGHLSAHRPAPPCAAPLHAPLPDAHPHSTASRFSKLLCVCALRGAPARASAGARSHGDAARTPQLPPPRSHRPPPHLAAGSTAASAPSPPFPEVRSREVLQSSCRPHRAEPVSSQGGAVDRQAARGLCSHHEGRDRGVACGVDMDVECRGRLLRHLQARRRHSPPLCSSRPARRTAAARLRMSANMSEVCPCASG